RIVAIEPRVSREVVARSTGDADERQVALDRDRDDRGERAVPARHSEYLRVRSATSRSGARVPVVHPALHTCLNPSRECADSSRMEAAASSWRRLGRLLVEDGLITEDQLDEALENQVRTRRLLGDIVVELGYVSSGDVERALAIQAGLTTADGVTFGTGLRSELERRAAEPAA